MRDMQEILFRGKRLDNDQWVEGDLSHNIQGEEYIRCWGWSAYKAYKIDPITLGRFTSLTDRNGVKIYEDDICCFMKRDSDGISKQDCRVVVYSDTAFMLCKHIEGKAYDEEIDLWWHWQQAGDFEVVGNIHDNPELLEGDGE